MSKNCWVSDKVYSVNPDQTSCSVTSYLISVCFCPKTLAKIGITQWSKPVHLCWYRRINWCPGKAIHWSDYEWVFHCEGWAQDWCKSDGCFSSNLISSPWRRYEDYNISLCKQWKFRCHCWYEQWHLNLHCLQRVQVAPKQGFQKYVWVTIVLRSTLEFCICCKHDW